jgi:hypothetical protein
MRLPKNDVIDSLQADHPVLRRRLIVSAKCTGVRMPVRHRLLSRPSVNSHGSNGRKIRSGIGAVPRRGLRPEAWSVRSARVWTGISRSVSMRLASSAVHPVRLHQQSREKHGAEIVKV